MSVTVGVRFRPVDDDDRPSEKARAEAKQRWSEALSRWTGVERYSFERSPVQPPAERLEVTARAKDVPPVDLTIEFSSRAALDSLFLNSEQVAELNGTVAGAHAVHVVGDPGQVNGTNLERPVL